MFEKYYKNVKEDLLWASQNWKWYIFEIVPMFGSLALIRWLSNKQLGTRIGSKYNYFTVYHVLFLRRFLNLQNFNTAL